MARFEVAQDMKDTVRAFMATASFLPGDRVAYDKVVDLFEQFGMAIRPKRRPGTMFQVDGIVSSRDHQPYVRLLWEGEVIVTLDIPQARQVAMDIVQMGARTEADAGLVKFLGLGEFDPAMIAAVITGLRDYRKAQDDKPTAEQRV